MFIINIFEILCNVRLEYVMAFVLFCHFIVFVKHNGSLFSSVLTACTKSEVKS